jgi:ABC-type Fe3+/spermidine/putrescine transport system ATPase subunit
LPWGDEVGLKQNASGTVKVSVRPEDIRLEATTNNSAHGTIETAVFMGSSVTYRVVVDDLLVRAMASGNEIEVLSEGQKVRIAVPRTVHVLREDGWEQGEGKI